MSQEVIAKYLPRSNGSLEFLNTVVQDLDGSRMSVQDLMKGELISIVANAIPTSRSLFPINEPDGMLLNHYDLEIARMTTTIDDDSNGFRLALIPMALSSSDFSAQSILHSTLAVSCYHLGRPQEALQHKIRAIKNLSDSFASFCIDTVDSATKIRHFAASMMLCVYGIIGVLGCSTEVLHLISCINHLRGLIRTSALSCTEKSSPNFCKGFLEIFPEIEQRLLHLQQDLLIHPGSTSGTINNTRIAFTAELYRIAAVLYFYQTVPAAFIPACNAQELVRNGLNILWEMKVCSSPWPLFILACTVTGDEDRIRILDLIETSGSSRRIGNYSIIIGLVRAVWKRQDLCTDDKEKRRVDWRDLIEKGGYMPSFI
ncbi:hypothetical protein ST47_g5412 [Ascochyta rabiei]|uniref:Uncharacterized protein n=1 Tax=Didymella rabiei TaxID=5454 RepID=A0A163E0U8_DIDRA|nr:hypothetical protein ST47_g5412 [Ascochyta rabiei]